MAVGVLMTRQEGSESNSFEELKRENDINKIFFDSITESLPQYIFWKDINSVYLGCNKNFSRLIGLASPRDIVGKTDYDLKWQPGGDTASAFRRGDLETLRGKPVNNREEVLLLPSGKKLITLVSKLPILDDGMPVGIVGYFTDITALRETEQREREALAAVLTESARASSEENLREAVMLIAGSIVHDMRTPLATVDLLGKNLSTYLPKLVEGYTKALEAGLIEKALRPSFVEVLSNTGETARQVSAQMNDYITTSLKSLRSAVAGELAEDDFLKCSVVSCLDKTMQNYRHHKEYHTLFELEYVQSFEFMGNEILMIRVLTNLIKNALYQIEKNEKGKITITTNVGDGMGMLVVKDTAGGIPLDQEANLFKSYQSAKQGGTGLGLAFCKRTIDEFGGSLTVINDFGQQVEFVIRLPLVGQK